jgi:hypothetical protein
MTYRISRPRLPRRSTAIRKHFTSMALLLAVAFAGPVAAFAQASPAPVQGSAALGLPDVPTTKILAIGRLTPKSTPGAMGAVLPQEVQDTLKLYLAGKIEQWYVRKDLAAVVFVLDVTDMKEAREMLAQLPLGRADLMEFDLIPLGPLSPLAMLSKAPAR